MAKRLLVDHTNVVSRCFIVHAPSAVHKCELPTCNQFLDKASLRSIQLAIPALEKGLFDVCKLTVWSQRQLFHNGIEDLPHSCMLYGIV